MSRLTSWPIRALLTLVLVLVPLVVGFLLVPETDVVQGDSPASLDNAATAVTITGDQELAQTMAATADGLSGIDMTPWLVATPPGCGIAVTVTGVGGAVLYDDVIPCREAADNEAATPVARFAPVPDSAGQTYTVTIRAVGEGSVLGFGLGTPKDGAFKSLTITSPDGTEPVPQVETGMFTVVVPVYEAGSRWATIGLALRHIGSLTPWWGQPAAVVVWALLGLTSLVTMIVAAGRRRLVYGALSVLATCRGLIWAAALPMMDGMDEPQHLSYVQYLAEQGLPGKDVAALHDAYSPQMQVAMSDSRFNALWPADRFDFTAVPETLRRVAEASPLSDGRPLVTQYSPLYYAVGAFFYRVSPDDGLVRFYDVRLASVVLGVVTALGVLACLRALVPARPTVAALAAAAVTLQPMMSHQSAIVNNDALILAASAWCLALTFPILRGEPRWWHPALAGGCAAAALLAKPQGIIILAMPVLAVLVAFWQSPGRRIATLATRMVALGGGFLLTYAWWPVYRWVAGLHSVVLPVAGGADDRSLRAYIRLQTMDGYKVARGRWSQQLFGNFSWLDVWLDRPVYNTITVILVLVALSWTVWAVARLTRIVVRRVHTHAALPGTWTTLGLWYCGALVLSFLVAINLIGYMGFRADGTDTILQGRYVLPILPGLIAAPILLTLRGCELWGRWRGRSPHDEASHQTPSAHVAGASVPDPRAAVRGRAALDLAVPAVAYLGLAMMLTLFALGLGMVVDRFYL